LRQISLNNFREILEGCENQRRTILIFLQKNENRLFTRREISEALNMFNSSVCARVKEMEERGLLRVYGKKICEITGQKNEAVGLVEK